MIFSHRVLSLLALFCPSSHGLVTPQSRLRLSERVLRSSNVEEEVNVVNGSLPSSVSIVSATADNKSRLASAFASLSENDQYDAVLTGLCAKILDDKKNDEQAIAALQDPIKLMQEMNARGIKASGRGLMALIDATIVTQDVNALAEMMSLGLKNGGVRQYGSLQNTMRALPPTPTGRVVGPDGSRKTRQERLDGLEDLPRDDRGAEVSAALAFSAYTAACGFANLFGMDDISPYTNTILLALAALLTIDNFYDVINFATGLAKDKVNLQLPEKGSLPLGLGTGQVTGTLFRGLVRLTTVDTERECMCEAAAFYAAYVLGLPCYAFRPNALESAVMVVESMKKDSFVDPLLSSTGILKMLIWVLAPVAVEASKHPQLVMSDPRESEGLLERLEDKASFFQDGDLFWTVSDDEKRDLLKWAFAEADVLIRSNMKVVTEISERLAGGAATVGDCVAVIEDW